MNESPQSQPIDTMIDARWIIPVEPEDCVFEHHSIVIHGGRIVAILPTLDAHRSYKADVQHRFPGHALIPGLVNAHTHAAMSLFRGLADDLPLMEWLNGYVWPAESRCVSDEFVRDGTRLAIAEMLRCGTTCFNDMYFFPDEVARIASDVGIRATVGFLVIDSPSVWAQNTDEYISKGLEVHDRYRNDPLIKGAFAPHAPYSVSDEALARIQVLAEELDIPVHTHLHETEDEVKQSTAKHGLRPLARLEQLGLLSPRLLAVHMTQLENTEIERVMEYGAHVVHCPESNLKLASGHCPVEALIHRGVNVALGTDGAASNNDLNMIGEIHTCALLAKGIAGAADAVPATQALRMATISGARALGLENDIGSLSPGKAADVVALNLSGVEAQPMYHPISQIVYAGSRDQVTDVWIAGRHVLKERTLLTLDEASVLKKAREWQSRIAGQ